MRSINSWKYTGPYKSKANDRYIREQKRLYILQQFQLLLEKLDLGAYPEHISKLRAELHRRMGSKMSDPIP